MALDSYLHGIETIEVEQGVRPITVVKSSVIGLIGVAPKGDNEYPILVTSSNAAAQFGQQIPGFTIPQALAAIFAQGPATVIVVNTFDEDNNTEDVTLEAQTITNGKLKLDFAPVGDVEIFLTNGTSEFAGVKDVDYSLDAFGNFIALSSTSAEGTVLKFTYSKLDVGSLTSAQIIGDNVDGDRSGLRCFELCYGLFGIKPKILISPVFIEAPAVAAALLSVAPKYRAITLPDAPEGTSIAGALASRGPAATSNFKTSSQRAYLLFPHLKAYDKDSDGDIVVPYSAYMAGLIARVDREEGYWVSPSNHEIMGITGTEIPIYSDFTDPESEANVLNSVGITTVYTGYGTGPRSWGNRSAAYPTDTSAKNFLSIRRIADTVHESLELGSFPFIDKPLNQAIIDAIRETGNEFFRVLVGRGAVLPGSHVEYIPEDNPSVELSAGHVQFNLVFMGPTPAERITYKSIIDINLLAQLK